MKCHIRINEGVTYSGTIDVLVEAHKVRFHDPSMRVHRDFAERDIVKAAVEHLTKNGAKRGIEWFEEPGKVRYRMVKHQMGDTYACVAVVPFLGSVVAS